MQGARRRALVPHGFLTKLDISKAKEVPGVVAVLTAEDIPGEHNHGLVVYDWPVLVGAGERVRYVGDALALVAAVVVPGVADGCVVLSLGWGRTRAGVYANGRGFDVNPVRVAWPRDPRRVDAPERRESGEAGWTVDILVDLTSQGGGRQAWMIWQGHPRHVGGGPRPPQGRRGRGWS